MAFYHALKAFLNLPLWGGFGPWLLVVVCLLGWVIPLHMYELRLARKVGPWLAARKTSPIGALFFGVMLACIAFYVSVK